MTTGKLFAKNQVRVIITERHITLIALYVCLVTQGEYVEERLGGLRSH